MRTSYDTAIKHLYRKGLEEALPKAVRKSIPRSTIHRWRHESDDKYLGAELNELANHELEMLKEFARNRNARRIFMAYVRIGRFIQSVTSEKTIRKLLKQKKEELMEVVERTSETLSMDQVLRCVGISRSTYNVWVLGMFNNCRRSSLDWCLVRQPHQLDTDEVQVMRDLLSDKQYEHWPVTSIAYHAQREGMLYASVSTWYKYSNILGLERKRAPYKKKRSDKGIKAHAPNEIWHADVTYFKVGLTTYYIYLVVDNFSKKIVSHLVSDTLSAGNRLKTIQMAFDAEGRKDDLGKELLLMVDGGSENNNHTVDGYVNGQPNLKKVTALKDIKFGNTQVEAHNRILKQSWLYFKEITSGEQLAEELNAFVEEFNNVRPHYSLSGMTPDETHRGVEPYVKTYREDRKDAREKRYHHNKHNACADCVYHQVKLQENCAGRTAC